jgi:prepilin-type N-terminal cleavage/methylation domain-containing protein
MNKGLKKGFTLIELLIVIVIIGILASVVLSILRPDLAQRRAREAVLRSNVTKACLALKTCGTSVGATYGHKCSDPVAELGLNTSNLTPTDTNERYCYRIGNATTTCGSSTLADLTDVGTASASLAFVGTRVTGASTCDIGCAFDFSTGTVTEVTVGAACAIAQ